MMHPFRLTLLTCLGVLLAACLSTQGRDAALKHDAGEPVPRDGRVLWSVSDDAAFFKVVLPANGLAPPTDFLPDDDPAVVRLQLWLDRLSAGMPAVAPKPRLKVLKDASANAFVTNEPLCYTVAVHLADTGGSIDAVAVDSEGKLVTPRSSACTAATSTPDALSAFAAWFNRRGDGCRLDVLSGPALAFTPSCPRAITAADAKRLVIYKTSNVITVHTALITAMSEGEVAAALMHELGHYYRAHETYPRAGYDFYYRAESDAAPRRPTPDPTLAPLGHAVEAAIPRAAEWRFIPRYPEQRLHSLLWQPLDEATRRLQATPGSPCAAWQSFAAAHASFPPAADVYAEGEPLAVACSATVNAVEHSPEGMQVFSRGFLGAVEIRLPSRVKLGNLPTGGLTLLALAEAVTADLRAKDPFVPIDQASAARLGKYTVEQEADEESLEGLVAAGLDLVDAKTLEFAFGALNEADPLGRFMLNLGLPMQTCHKLHDTGWRDLAGAAALVPLGDFIEPHHSACYRVYNIDREIRAHGYPVPGSGKPLQAPPGPEWSTIQAHVAALGATERHATPAGLGCRFSP